MNPTTFFENFNFLCDAPNGIEKLRELILQLAVQGKLVEQDGEDEPASVLLEKIEAEKERLVKEGKIRKSKTSSLVDEKETPFDVPGIWKWTKLDNVSHSIHYGYTASAKHDITKIRLLRITDIQNNKVNWDSVPGCEIDERKLDDYRLNNGDILIARTGGTVGKSYLVKNLELCAVFASYLIRVIPSELLSADYLKLFSGSSLYWTQLYPKCSGTGQPNVNATSLKSLYIPLPPLAEQKRIVEKVDELMALCDELETRRQKKQELRAKLNGAALDKMLNAESQEKFEESWQRICENLDLLYDNPKNVGKLRQAILQLAVQGKLVKQDGEDEPASVLVEKIKEEKKRLIKEGVIKKTRSIVPITHEEIEQSKITAELPKGWKWIRLSDVGEFCGGGTPSKNKPEYWEGTVPWVSPKDMKELRIRNSEMKISDRALNETRIRIIPKNSILIVARSGILKRTLPVSINDIECTVNQDLKVIIPFYPAIVDYLQLMLKGYESLILKHLVKGGVTVQSLKYSEFEMYPFPLPPINEQKRIVEKVEQLSTLCDALELKLKKAQEDSGRLMESVVQNLLAGAAE